MAPEIPRNLDKPYSQKYGASVDWWAFGYVLYELLSLPKHKALFGSVAYVAWNSKNYGKPGLYPALLQLGPIAADLVKRLVDIITTLRYRFKDIAKHEYFSNGDGTSEFRGACSRAVQREEQSDMLPSLRDEETETVNIWRPYLPGGRSTLQIWIPACDDFVANFSFNHAPAEYAYMMLFVLIYM
ncbi:hypothetical protein CY34DRAFT_803414 [Suillus luteus UH-Slu-Lm8-n1]|uniref:Protein kinase domain-containing protein n=1 Tax=Suillus luteus UH-Slu-Lm8-n1 TaxID=930992 RepID=A0A0D0A1G2_9AGAM|nr:hypothetical protein CY34DRAFT_803414 [Suillus luteus UH-Slu-Lm8-n1]